MSDPSESLSQTVSSPHLPDIWPDPGLGHIYVTSVCTSQQGRPGCGARPITYLNDPGQAIKLHTLFNLPVGLLGGLFAGLGAHPSDRCLERQKAEAACLGGSPSAGPTTCQLSAAEGDSNTEPWPAHSRCTAQGSFFHLLPCNVFSSTPLSLGVS